MAGGPVPAAPGDEAGTGDAHGTAAFGGPWLAALERAMPWLMGGWAVAQLALVVLLAEPLRLDEGGRFAPAVFLLATVASLLVVAGLVLAAGNAAGTRGVPRVAWAVAAATFLLMVPLLLGLYSEEGEDEVDCPRWGFVPAGAMDALFGWLSPLHLARLVPGLLFVGVGFLFAGPTRRQGAWMLAATALASTLGLAAFGLMVDGCPEE